MNSSSRVVTITDAANAEGAMDEGLWSELPEELVDRTLAWLPIPSFFRMSSVCKRWSSLLNDPSFLSMCAFGKSHAPWCILPEEKGYAVYDSASNTWHKWPDFELSTKTISGANDGSASQCSRIFMMATTYQIVAAASGLVLLESRHDDSSRTLFVANPINKYARQLRLRFEMEMTDLSTILGMVMDEATGNYKVLEVFRCEDCVIGCNNAILPFRPQFQLDAQTSGLSHYGQYPLEFHVYDSSSCDWARTGDWDKQLNHYFRRLAFYDGSIFCLTSDLPFDFLHASPNLHVYRITEEGWMELEAQLPNPLHFAHLFEDRGRLMLAGGTEESDNSKSLQSLHIWHLDSVKLQWNHVQSMPPNLIQELSRSENGYYRCVSSGGYICVTNSQRTIVMCDVARNFWWLVSRNRSLGRKYGDIHMFQPSLDIIP